MASQILHWQKMVFAESADSGFINRSFVGEFAPAGRFSIHIGVWYLVLPTSLTTFYYPGIWVCTCGLFGGACDLYHIVLRWTRWYHVSMYKLTDPFAPRSKWAR